MTPSTIRGLNVYVPGPASYIQATSSCLTFDLLICLRDEYCEESAPPRYWFQVSKDRSAAGTGAAHIDSNIESTKLGAADLCIIGEFTVSPAWSRLSCIARHTD